TSALSAALQGWSFLCHRALELPRTPRPHRYDVPPNPGRAGGPICRPANPPQERAHRRYLLEPCRTAAAHDLLSPLLPLFRALPRLGGMEALDAQALLVVPSLQGCRRRWPQVIVMDIGAADTTRPARGPGLQNNAVGGALSGNGSCRPGS